MNWLRRKLRVWLGVEVGVEECHHPLVNVLQGGETLEIGCKVPSCDEKSYITLPSSGGVAP